MQEADGDVYGQNLEILSVYEKLGQGLGDGGTIRVTVTEHNGYPVAFGDIGACDDGHGDTLAEFWLGFAYLVEPGKSLVITSVGLGDPAKLGF
jgi:hypothetical protein